MAYRQTPLVNEEFYHIYNRGIALQPIFFHKKDYERFLLCLSYYRFGGLHLRLSRLLQIPKADREQLLTEIDAKNLKIVELVAFCLLPNHFHILLRQVSEGGISKFAKELTNSFTRYFNTKYERIGPIFQGAFKAVHVSSDEQLLHLSRYIHLNPLVSFVVRDEDFIDYPWSSLSHFIKNSSGMVNVKPVLDQFATPEKYLEFVCDQANYGKELEKIKHLTLEK